MCGLCGLGGMCGLSGLKGPGEPYIEGCGDGGERGTDGVELKPNEPWCDPYGGGCGDGGGRGTDGVELNEVTIVGPLCLRMLREVCLLMSPCHCGGSTYCVAPSANSTKNHSAEIRESEAV